MMTEKQRRAALDDETNFFYTRRFPYRDGDPIKITEFEFYGLRIYKMISTPPVSITLQSYSFSPDGSSASISRMARMAPSISSAKQRCLPE